MMRVDACREKRSRALKSVTFGAWVKQPWRGDADAQKIMSRAPSSALLYAYSKLYNV